MIRPRPGIRSAPPAVHGGPGSAGEEEPRLDFSHNVNVWGPPPPVAAAARRADPASYPDPDARRPREAVARRWGIPVERIRFAPGAAELIHRVCRVFAGPDDRVLHPGPTFCEYARGAALAGAAVEEVRGVPPHYRLPVEDLVGRVGEIRPRLVFLCAPNSPTGGDPGREAVEAVLEALPGRSLLVLDGSFRSFADGAFVPADVPDDPRLLRIRSLTKDFALAGLRAGIAVGDPEVLEALDAGAVPWATSAPAQTAAAAAMDDAALAHLERSVTRLRRDRRRLAGALRRCGWRPSPSDANFILCRVPDRERAVAGLASRGIRVRDCASFGLFDHLRVAVRTPDDNEELVRAVEETA